MEIIKVGEISIEKIIDFLFKGENLYKLIGDATACFVLVESFYAADFHEALIKNIDSIDFTTRNHIAFIVFYGNNSSLSRTLPSYGIRRAESKKINGFSFSHDKYNQSNGTMLNIGKNKWEDIVEVNFDEELGNEIRKSSNALELNRFKKTMSTATNKLMNKFNILEAQLPCLLFVNYSNSINWLTVKLNPNEPLKSLYIDILKPISESLRVFENFLSIPDQIENINKTEAEARKRVKELPSKLDELNNKLIEFISEKDKKIECLRKIKHEEKSQFDKIKPFYENCKEIENKEKKLIPSTSPFNSIEAGLQLHRVIDERIEMIKFENIITKTLEKPNEFASDSHKNMEKAKASKQLSKAKLKFLNRLNDFSKTVKQIIDIEQNDEFNQSIQELFTSSFDKKHHYFDRILNIIDYNVSPIATSIDSTNLINLKDVKESTLSIIISIENKVDFINKEIKKLKNIGIVSNVLEGDFLRLHNLILAEKEQLIKLIDNFKKLIHKESEDIQNAADEISRRIKDVKEKIEKIESDLKKAKTFLNSDYNDKRIESNKELKSHLKYLKEVGFTDEIISNKRIVSFEIIKHLHEFDKLLTQNNIEIIKHKEPINYGNTTPSDTDDFNTKIRKARWLVSQDRMHEALEIISEICPNSSYFQNQLIGLKNRLSMIKRQFNQNTLDDDKILTSRNRVNQGILELLDEIEIKE